jgi:two-component system, OmpR family, sensor kinase
MDGFKRWLRASIQLRLSFWISLAILVVAGLAGVFSFVSALGDAHELQDDILKQVAAQFERQPMALPSLNEARRDKDDDEKDDHSDKHRKKHDDDSHVIVQTLATGGAPQSVRDGDVSFPVPPTLADGLHTLRVKNEFFRVLIRTMTTGKRIAVAQETGIRDEIAMKSALRTVTPFLVLVPILLLVATYLVRTMLRPVKSLAADIDSRGDQELHALTVEHLPSEVRPFVVAINRLLARVAQSMETQRRFVADAAHELRSPLTALSLQAERLAQADMSGEAHERLIVLRQGVERGRNLLDQLLTLARVQSAESMPKTEISVLAVYRRVLEDLMPLAHAKHIDIGIEGDSDARVAVDEMDLTTVIKNLVDNAIRYTPEGGRVDLSVAVEGLAILSVRDTGPGIPMAERERVFDPFYRILGTDQVGSGLGLSIVKAIADRIGARIALTFTDESAQAGLCVTVSLPAIIPRRSPEGAPASPDAPAN